MTHLTSTTRIDTDVFSIQQIFQDVRLDDGRKFTVVDCETYLSDMIDILQGLPTKPPSIYVDLEGVKLSREGTISILQVYVLPSDHTYLVDIHRLKERAFSTTGKNTESCLKAILEAENIPKVFFDVRNDSNALFYHFRINLSGVDDVQVMEIATRNFPKRYLSGLQKCIERDATMTIREKSAWIIAKEEGMKLFLPEKGGRYEVFNERPLPDAIIQYCVLDVQFLPRLWSHYKKRMTPYWAEKVQKETKERVLSSQRDDYNGHGRHKALAPQGWYSGTGSSRLISGWGSRYDGWL
jgi:exonuclease 3'-5' domain-containing protein 1